MTIQELAQEAIDEQEAIREAELAEMHRISEYERGSYWGGDMEYTQEDAYADQLAINAFVDSL
jgi:hypothetical protein